MPIRTFIDLQFYCVPEPLEKRNAFGSCIVQFRLQQSQLQAIKFCKLFIGLHVNDWLADYSICFIEHFKAVIKFVLPDRARTGLCFDGLDFFPKFGEFSFVGRRQLKLVTADTVNLSIVGGNDGLG